MQFHTVCTMVFKLGSELTGHGGAWGVGDERGTPLRPSLAQKKGFVTANVCCAHVWQFSPRLKPCAGEFCVTDARRAVYACLDLCPAYGMGSDDAAAARPHVVWSTPPREPLPQHGPSPPDSRCTPSTVSGPSPRREALDAVRYRSVSTTRALCHARTGHCVAPGQRRVSAMPL
jgi:hypothetical protein